MGKGCVAGYRLTDDCGCVSEREGGGHGGRGLWGKEKSWPAFHIPLSARELDHSLLCFLATCTHTHTNTHNSLAS